MLTSPLSLLAYIIPHDPGSRSIILRKIVQRKGISLMIRR